MCVRSTILYGTETWSVKDNVMRLENVETSMVKGMCNATVSNGLTSVYWKEDLGLSASVK